jgi:hypothetical protein
MLPTYYQTDSTGWPCYKILRNTASVNDGGGCK